MSPKERLDSWLTELSRFAARHGGPNRLLPIAGVVAGVLLFASLFALNQIRPGQGPSKPDHDSNPPPVLSARTSDALRAAVVGEPLEFDAAITHSIQEHGWLSATVHVALYEDGRRGRRLGDGASPDGNMYWGALFGVDNFLVNEGGWTRVFTDSGGGGVIRRSVFKKSVTLTESWIERGVEAPFDIYLLASAWPHSRIREAMNQPLREARCGDHAVIQVDGKSIDFGSASVLVGYLGQNEMLSNYWDPFLELKDCPPPLRQAGIFYIAPRSGILLHRPAVEHGLYSVLFAREIITPEAYVLAGMLDALTSGEMNDAFLENAADSYARYQKSVTPTQARIVLVR